MEIQFWVTLENSTKMKAFLWFIGYASCRLNRFLPSSGGNQLPLREQTIEVCIQHEKTQIFILFLTTFVLSWKATCFWFTGLSPLMTFLSPDRTYGRGLNRICWRYTVTDK